METVFPREVLKKNEHQFRNLVEKAPVAICVLRGKDYLIEVFNEAMTEIWDITLEQALNKPVFEVLPELIGQGFEEILGNVYISGQRFVTQELPISLMRQGTLRKAFVKFVFEPIHETNGSITGIIAVAHEITEQVAGRKKMEAQSTVIRDLLMTAPGFVCTLIGPDHVYDLVNKEYQSIFGKRQLEGKPIWEALPELKGQGFEIVLDRVYETGEPYVGIEMPAYMANDEGELVLRYFNYSYQPLYDEDKQVYAILAFGYEVTEQVIAKNRNLESEQLRSKELEEKVTERTYELNKLNYELGQKNKSFEQVNKLLLQKQQELEESQKKQLSEYSRRLIEATLDPLITIDLDGNITDVNKAMIEATDKKRTQLVGTNFIDYFIEKDKAQDVYEQVFAKGSVINYSLTIIDGVVTNVLVNASVFKNEEDKVIGAVLVTRDVTELKQIEKELTEAKKFAEQATEIAVEAQSKAESSTQIAENAVKAKQQFLSNMSHEIRTPMNAIIGFTKVLLRTEITTKQKEYLTAIKLSGDSLIVLINDILDLAKVDAGKMTFEQNPFKLSASIAAVSNLFEIKVQEKNLTLVKEYDHSIPEVLVGDPVRLHQIILNLLSNAVKFTAKGKITLAVRLLEDDDELATIEFAVSDTGMGIPEDKQETIFENFQQASSDTARLFGGTGLGLAIVKQLLEPQGGRINVKSKIDEGSTFSFVLSFQKTKAEAQLIAEIMDLDAEIKNIKVLVVEDIELNQLLMKTILDDFGFESDIASNGKLAIEKLKSTDYDIVLMDLQMPVMNGFETTEYIRQKMNSNIPIIALTADVTTVDGDKCKAVGMNDYLAKPLDERLLFSKIVGMVTESAMVKLNESKKARYIDLKYLNQRTKSNPKLMAEMITLYLEQTPQLITSMKESLEQKDWKMLQSSVHKIIPSFSIMGINPDFENLAIKIQEYATQQLIDGIQDMVLQLENVCLQACKELEEELTKLKTPNHVK